MVAKVQQKTELFLIPCEENLVQHGGKAATFPFYFVFVFLQNSNSCAIIGARRLPTILNAQEVQKGDAMTEQAKQAKREYQREWAKKNPDKVKAAQDRFWSKKAKEATQAQQTQDRA